MAEERKHIDDVFTEALRGYTEVPPPQAWNALEAKLDQQGGRRRLAWWWYVVVGISLVSTGFLYLNNRKGDTIIPQVKKAQPLSKPAIGSSQPIVATNVAPVGPTPAEEAKPEVPAPDNTPTRKEEKALSNTERSINDATAVSKKKADAIRTNKQGSSSAERTGSAAPTIAKETSDATAQQPITAYASTEGRGKDTITPLPLAEGGILEDMIKDRTGVVMNIRKLPPIVINTEEETPVAAAIPVDTVVAPPSENQGPLVKQNSIVSTGAPINQQTNVVEAAQTNADSIVNAVARALTQETEALLASTQDAIVPTGPQAIAASVVFEEQVPIPGSDSFIGPMPDTESFLAVGQVPETTIDTASPDKPRYKLNLEGFVKAGYEKGFADYSMNKFVLAPMLQLNLSRNLSLVMQPAIKAGTVNNHAVGDRQSFHKITTTVVDSVKRSSTSNNAQGIIYTSEYAQYYFRQVHDSITIDHSIAEKTLFEIELPLLLKYQFKGIGVYAGPAVTYGKVALVNQNINTYENITRVDTLTYNITPAYTPIAAPGINEVFSYNTPDISKYDNSPYQNTTVNRLRLGMVVGASINLNNKLTVDLLMQQNLSRMNYIPNSQVKSIYLQPYFRFMLGYKVFGNNKNNKHKK